MVDNHLELEAKLLAITKDFLTEIDAERSLQNVSMQALLDRDLGIGSLEKVELFHRIEKNFTINLSDSVIATANSLAELQQIITQVHAPTKVIYKEVKNTIPAAQVDVTAARTLIEVLKLYANQEPRRPHLYLLDEEGQETIIRYGDLFARSMTVARGLFEQGLKQGETVAIMLPTSEDFFYAFFGVLFAGGIPVPIYPPFRPNQIEEYAQREAKILSNAGVRVLITFDRAESLSKLLKVFIPGLKTVTTVAALNNTNTEIPKLNFSGEDPALIQYTSGSTSDPKGVLLSHFNLLSNLRAAGKALQITENDRVVSWLPLYHDMGLIGTWLGSLYFGIPVTIMSPLFFLNRPERWLWAIHHYRGTISAGPNFAYELCVKKITDELIEDLDLSSWRLALNGAEPIQIKTLESFQQRFSAYGLKPETIYPVYGLAESTVALAFPPLNRIPWIDKIVRGSFEKERRAILADVKEKNYLEFVSCGSAIPGHAIRIVDDNGNELAERHIGNLQFKGPSSMIGYYRNAEATQAVYKDGWWNSGDLAYMANNEVFITGRKKDLIIKAGRNLYAAELEEIAGQVEGVRKGCVVAFGVLDVKSGSEKLIIIAESFETQPEKRQKIFTEITKKITIEIGMPPDQVLLVKPKTIPKTSSGKLRRAASKEGYLQGKLQHATMPTWFQFSKLFLISQFKKTINLLNKAGRTLYTAYVVLLVAVMFIPLSLGVLLLTQRLAAKFCHHASRFILRLAGCPLKINGRNKLKNIPTTVFVANHASYLDSLVLTAVLPNNPAFVAKKELLNVPLVGTFIRKMRYLTIDRNDFSKSLSEIQLMEKTLTAGRSIVIFPEGTFTYASGLRPFKLGAFKVAGATQRPICPIAIAGTRKILRDENWLLRPGRIQVTIGDLVTMQDNEWSEQIRTRALVRSIIAKDCGEPAIDVLPNEVKSA